MTTWPIRIPDRLQELLGQDVALAGAVASALSNIRDLLSANQHPFFPHYPDHGVAHVEAVLDAASHLIPDDVWSIRGTEGPVLKPRDAAVLVLAVASHDLALFMTPMGLRALIAGDWPSLASRIDDKRYRDEPWPDLWQRFCHEARRMDERRLHLLLGPRPVADYGSELLRAPSAPFGARFPEHPADFLLVGEFVRRHHPRLAHEVVWAGFPAASITFPPLIHTLAALPDATALADIVGVVARSHGMDMRVCIDDLDRQYGLRSRAFCRHSLPVYHMALLRVADFLHLERTRAPALLYHLLDMESPASLDEWKKHNCIDALDWAVADPQAVDILIQQPPTVRICLQLQRLFANIQREMDHASAVLAESCSPWERYGLHSVRLAKTRISHSTGDSRYLASLPYVSEHSEFSASTPDLMALLIGPLYGDRPEIGIRELTQNALDAVHELRRFRQMHPRVDAALNDGRLVQYPQNTDVLISLERDGTSQWWCRVTDRGIGMTADIVRNYFLRAGASLRTSDAWRQEYLDDHGRSTVLRSGRFGVGVFAALLLGDRLFVETRHVLDDSGLKFQAALPDDEIELTRVATAPVGTSIRIPISDDVAERLMDHVHEDSWRWYSLEDPSVLRVVNGSTRPDGTLPDARAIPDFRWRKCNVPPYSDVWWSHYPGNTLGDRLVCNGIVVVRNSVRNQLTWPHTFTDGTPLRMPLGVPRIVVFDPDAALPLALDRCALRSNKIALFDILARDVGHDFLAWVVAQARLDTARDVLHFTEVTYNAGPNYQGFVGADRTPWFARCADGITLFSPAMLHAINASEIVRVQCSAHHLRRFPCPPGRAVVYSRMHPEHGYPVSHDHINAIKLQRACGLGGIWGPIPKEVIEDPFVADIGGQPEPTPAKADSGVDIVTEHVDGNYSQHRLKTDRRDGQPLYALVRELVAMKWQTGISQFPLRWGSVVPQATLIDDMWLEMFGGPIIPYDPEKRRQCLDGCEEKLEPHFGIWKRHFDEDRAEPLVPPLGAAR